MKTTKILTATALAGILSLAVAQAAHAADTANEKCYGVAKAGKNDCGTSSNACAGKSTKDGDASDFVMVPTGLCEKLVHGSLTPSDAAKDAGKMMMEEKH